MESKDVSGRRKPQHGDLLETIVKKPTLTAVIKTTPPPPNQKKKDS